MTDKGNWTLIAERRLAEIHRLRAALGILISSITCLCAEGPELMQPREIYDALIKDARKAQEVLDDYE